jgi:uncharacterized lipoprotein
VALAVADARSSPIIGQRGGIYSSTASITAAGDPASGIFDTVSGALRSRGFQVHSAQSYVPVRMTVELETLQYTAEGAPAVKSVKVLAAVRVKVASGNREFSGRYEADYSRQVVTPPDAQENERLINETLARALERMLGDSKLMAFLTG